MKKLAEIIEHATINRATLLGYGLCTGGIAGMVESALKHNTLSFLFSFDAAYLGAYILLDTKLGKNTYETYERTKSHIKKHKRLSKEFVGKFENEYCTMRGVCKAAKELGYYDDFKRVVHNKRTLFLYI